MEQPHNSYALIRLVEGGGQLLVVWGIRGAAVLLRKERNTTAAHGAQR